MSDKKYAVPEGMIKACSGGMGLLAQDRLEIVLEAALRWQSEDWKKSVNAQRMPEPWYTNSFKRWGKFSAQWKNSKEISFVDLLIFFANLLNERYVAFEPEVPEEINELMLKEKEDDLDWDTCCRANERILEAYRRGKKAGEVRE